jgi:DNA polymerase-3 subunit delta'
MAGRKRPVASEDPRQRQAVLLARAAAPWLGPPREQLGKALREGHLAHGILIHGTRGCGQSEMALWAAHMVLCEHPARAPCGQCPACALFLAGNHPDFYSIELEEKASFIKVDQVRELSAKLALRSYLGGSKVGVIDPADRMNLQANNALLKTLEEPPEDTVLFLSASRVDRLPRTVVSRCQRVRIATPAAEVAVGWLGGEARRGDWPELLGLAAGAPFRALEMAEEGVGEVAGDMRATFLPEGIASRFDALGLAESWSADHPDIRLAWLEKWLEDRIRGTSAGSDLVNNNQEFRLPSAGTGLNIGPAFVLLDKLREVRGLLESSLNTQLLLEDLLVRLVDTLVGRPDTRD